MSEPRSRSERALIATAAVLGALGVTLGAFGAHALAEQLDAQAEQWWHTATFYLLVHAAAGLGVAASRRAPLAAALLLFGAALFSATLYAMALGAARALGMVTPLGGAAMIAGWIVLAIATVLQRDPGQGESERG